MRPPNRKKKNMSLTSLQIIELFVHGFFGAGFIWFIGLMLVMVEIVLILLLTSILKAPEFLEFIVQFCGSLVIGGTIGLMLGYIQYLMMKEVKRPMGSWVGASILGGAMGIPFMFGVSAIMSNGVLPDYYLLWMPLFMLCVSSIQALVLREWTSASWLWIVLNVFAGAVFSLIAFEHTLIAIVVQTVILTGGLVVVLHYLPGIPHLYKPIPAFIRNALH